MTFILGLTGGIATGKTTVSRYFMQCGIPVIDADKIARLVVEPGTEGLAAIVQTFGEQMLLKDGQLNRKALGQLVFQDEMQRAWLDQILAAELHKGISEAIEQAIGPNRPLIVADIPLLFEAGYEASVDEVMVVYVPVELQIKRLMARNQLTEAEARARIASQWSIEEKKNLADVIIDNQASVVETEAQVRQWLYDRQFSDSLCD